MFRGSCHLAVTVACAACVACGSSASSDPDPAGITPAPVPPAAPPAAGTEGADTLPPSSAPPTDTSIPRAARLLAEAQRILGASKHSTYTHTTYVDEATGTFDFDCSGFVDYALGRVVPDGFAALADKRPVAQTFVSVIGSTSPPAPWTRVALAASLVPGDVVTWLEPPGSTSSNTGHVMVVSAMPTRVGAEVHVPIIDSTDTPHGATDSRTPTHATGIGSGAIALVTDSSGAPKAYRWSLDSGSPTVATTIRLGHLAP